MSVLKIISFAVIAIQASASPHPETRENEEQKVAVYDPRLLNQKLQQLGLQPSVLQIQGLPFHNQLPTAQPQVLTTARENQSPIQQLYIQYLQNKLFQPSNEGSLDDLQPNFAPALQIPQTLRRKENLLGVAFSSATDASRIMFTGHGVQYSF